jgi:hypothetical protein
VQKRGSTLFGGWRRWINKQPRKEERTRRRAGRGEGGAGRAPPSFSLLINVACRGNIAHRVDAHTKKRTLGLHEIFELLGKHVNVNAAFTLPFTLLLPAPSLSPAPPPPGTRALGPMETGV